MKICIHADSSPRSSRSKRRAGALARGLAGALAGALALVGCATDDELEPAGDAAPFADGERAFPGERGEIATGLVETPHGPRHMTYELLHGYAVVEGDILLPAPGGTPRGNGRTRARWPGGKVPFTIDAGLVDQFRVTDAIAHWEAQTQLDFVARTTETDFVTFRTSTGCSSPVGRSGGQQFINLAPGCSTGSTIHEIGHAVGLWHEQSRTDRSSHIVIHPANITPGTEHNFFSFVESGSDGRNDGPYDLASIMHYGSFSFSANGQPTITELDGSLIVANRAALTATDACAAKRAQGFGQRSDLDGDGFADLAIGVPGEDIGGLTDAGAISVLYGGATGLTVAGNQLIHLAGTLGAAGDQFGAAVTTGDFNGDCLADVAVGAPFDDVGAIGNAGSVHIFYGAPGGLAATSDQVWHQDTVGIPGAAAAGDRFGTALASGDFDGDGFMDLAIGNPHKKATSPFGGPSIADVGSVVVLYGSAAGLSATGVQVWNQGAAIGDTVEIGDRFGAALAAGDFNRDGFDSLAVGSPGENGSAGSVHVIQGSLAGLTATGSQLLTEGTSGIPDAPEGGEQFGAALASGDFDNDGRADLAIGIPFEDVTAVDAGSVTVVFGGAAELNLAAGVESWNQNSASVTDVSEAADAFGSALDAGDFDNDGFTDLAIGVPGETIDAVLVAFAGAGAVHLLRGNATGMTAIGNLFLHQDTAGIAGSAAVNDHFGQRVRSGDFNGDAIPDLAVAVPDEDSSTLADSGALHVLLSRAGGVTSTGSLLFSQDSTSVLDTCELDDHFSGGL